MEIEVIRIGQRVIRDDRVTTHVALVSRAFGATKIYMNEINPDIKKTMEKINDTWGGSFKIMYKENLKEVIKKRKKESYKIIHLTMYGESINEIQKELQKEEKVVIIVGAEKVPREIYELADYNVAVGNQPHSEISSLAVVLDRIQKGLQFKKSFVNAKRRVIPTKQGKNVIVSRTRDL